jgi:TP901 family phage tail tape measure protein
MAENVTTKFRVDISDLKKNLAEANNKVKLYTAELKNASAGMEKGEENADSLTKKIAAQQKIVEAEKQKLAALKAELQRYEDTLQKGESIVADLTRRHEDASKAFGKDSEQAKALAKQLQQAQAAQERNAKAADDLRVRIVNQDSAVKNAEGQVRQYSTALDHLQTEETETGEAAQKTTDGGLNAFAVALGNLASQAISKAVQALKNFAKSVVDTGIAFDESMSNVKAISCSVADDAIPALEDQAKEMGLAFAEGANATETAMNILESKAEQMGRTTKFTANEVADAFWYMAMAGWKTGAMLDGIDGVMNLAAASGSDLAETCDIVTDALTAFGESSGEAGRLADIMAAASSNANTNVSMMGETFKYAAPLAGALGYSMEDTALATGLMANAGIKATQAGTSLRGFLTRMSAPTKESAAAMEELGLSLEDGEGNMKSLKIVLEELRSAFGDINIPADEFTAELAKITTKQNELAAALEAGEISQEKYNKEMTKTGKQEEELMHKAYGAEGALKAQYASMLAGKNAMSGFLAIVNASDEDFNNLADAIDNSKGAAEEMQKTMIDNLGGDLTLLSSAFDGLKMSIYNGVQAPFREIIQSVTNGLMPALESLVKGEDGAAEKLGKALSGLLEKAFDFVVSAAPDMMRTLGTLLSESLPALLDSMLTNAQEILGVLLSAAGDLLENLVEKLPDLLMKFSGDFVPKLLKVLAKVMQRLSTSLPKIIKTLVPAVTNALMILTDVLIENLPVLLDGIISLISAVVQALPDIMPAIMALVSKLMQMVGELLADPTSLQFIIDFVAALGVELLAAAGGIISAIWESIKPQIMELLTALQDTFDEWLTGVKQRFFGVVDAIKNGIASFVTAWKSGFDTIAKKASDAWERIKTGIANFVDAWKSGFDTISQKAVAAWENVKAAFAGVGEFFGGIWDTIKEKFTTIGTKIGDAVGGAFKNAINAVLQTVENSINFVPQAINSALETINQLPGVDIPYMPNIQLPRLAKGGITNGPTIAEIGEAGEEAVIPLEKNTAGLKKIASLLRDEIMGTNTGTKAPQPVYNYNFNQTNNSPKALNRWEIYRQSQNALAQIRGAKNVYT